MNKISIDLLHSSGDFDAFSPVVWDGANVIIASESAFNLKRIRADLLNLKSKLSTDLSEFKQREETVSGLASAVEEQVTIKSDISDRLLKLEGEVFPNITNQSGLSVQHSIAEAELYDQLGRADKLAETASMIREGRLVKAIGRDISVNNSSGYMLEGKSADGNFITSDNGIVEVQYFADKNTYHLTGGIPNVEALTLAGAGIKLTVDESKYVTIDLIDNLITGTNGIQVTQTNGVYTLNVSPDFITAEPAGGLVVERSASGTFSLDFSDEVKAQLAKKYYAGYGVIISGKTISLDPNVLPKFTAGSGLKLEKVSTNPDTYRISFDINSAQKPKAPVVTGESPIDTLKFHQDDGKDIHVVSLNKSFTDNIIENLIALEDAALQLHNNSQYLMVDNFSDKWRQSFMCPLLRLFSFMTGDYEGSGLVKENADPIEMKLLKLFGAKTVTLNMNENMLPYLAYSDMGSGTIMGIENDVDLFIPLQNKLRELLGDPTFFIPDSQKGTKYKITKVDTGSMSYKAKSRDQLPQMFYNMEFALSALNGWGSEDWAPGVVSATKCSPVTLSNWNSTKYAGMPLMITGGDADFIAGIVRAGQTNGTKLSMPAGLTESVKLKILTATPTEDATSITYVLKIQDDYTGQTYNAKFKRAVGPANIQPNTDYITELEGQSNPGHVRAYARLYTNWKLPDTDLNRMLYFLGVNGSCMATFSGHMIYRGTVEQKVWTPTYLQTVGYTAGIGFNVVMDPSKIDYNTGNAKLSINLTSGSVGYSQFPIDLMMTELKFGITYQFTISADSVYDVTQLFDPCCWGDDFQPKSKLTCGIDDVQGDAPVPHSPAPESNFGKVADILRQGGSFGIASE